MSASTTEPVVVHHGRPKRAFRMEAVCFNSLLGGVDARGGLLGWQPDWFGVAEGSNSTRRLGNCVVDYGSDDDSWIQQRNVAFWAEPTARMNASLSKLGSR